MKNKLKEYLQMDLLLMPWCLYPVSVPISILVFFIMYPFIEVGE
jgi:hypothetical protein